MIRVTIRGAKETEDLFRRLPGRLTLALVKGITDLAIAFWSKAKVNAPVFRGLLRESLLYNVQVEKGRIVGRVGSALAYAPVVEFGRGQGWFPNVTELRTWARRKLGTDRVWVEGKQWNLAYIIGRAIATRGFDAQPYMTPAFAEVAPRARAILETRISEMIRAEGGGAKGGKP